MDPRSVSLSIQTDPLLSPYTYLQRRMERHSPNQATPSKAVAFHRVMDQTDGRKRPRLPKDSQYECLPYVTKVDVTVHFVL